MQSSIKARAHQLDSAVRSRSDASAFSIGPSAVPQGAWGDLES